MTRRRRSETAEEFQAPQTALSKCHMSFFLQPDLASFSTASVSEGIFRSSSALVAVTAGESRLSQASRPSWQQRLSRYEYQGLRCTVAGQGGQGPAPQVPSPTAGLISCRVCGPMTHKSSRVSSGTQQDVPGQAESESKRTDVLKNTRGERKSTDSPPLLKYKCESTGSGMYLKEKVKLFFCHK